MPIDRESLLEFLGRDWAGSRRRKDRHTARRIEKLGAAEALRYQQLLWDHVGAKSQITREEDRQAHLALQAKLARYAEYRARFRTWPKRSPAAAGICSEPRPSRFTASRASPLTST